MDRIVGVSTTFDHSCSQDLIGFHAKIILADIEKKTAILTKQCVYTLRFSMMFVRKAVVMNRNVPVGQMYIPGARIHPGRRRSV